MTGGGNGGTTPMTMTPPTTEPTPPANAPLPPTLSFSVFDRLTNDQFSPALTTPINTDNDSITHGADPQDSVNAVTNSVGIGFFTDSGATVAFRVNNDREDWTTNAPSLLMATYIFDDATFARKTDLADYENGDFYIISGFWHRNNTDFGVFADGSPYDSTTHPLPTTGTATYRGKVYGYTGLAGFSAEDDNNFNTDIILSATFSNSNIIIGGMFNDGGAIETLNPAQYILENITDNDRDGVFEGGVITCTNCFVPAGADTSWSGRFVGNPIANAANGGNSDGLPAGFIGAFGGQLDSANIIGSFGTIHEDLCVATGTGDAAFCTK